MVIKHLNEHAGLLVLVETFDKVVDEIKASMSRTTGQVMLDVIDQELESIKRLLIRIPLLGHYLLSLGRHDEYTACHSIGVALISRLIGRSEGLGDIQMKELTAGAVLHDIGKIRVPREILQKPGKLSKEEYEQIKFHAEFGFEMLQNIKGIPSSAAVVALQHHERENGSGYPYGLSQHEIHPFSKIVAVADVFHSMISKRAYKDPLPFYHVLKGLSENIYGTFEPQAVLHIQITFMEMSIGSQVRLSNGHEGTLIEIQPDDPLYPLVEVCGELIDLSQIKNLHVERIF